MGSNCDRQSDLKAFDDSKSGVKGLVDAGLSKIPPFFIHKQPITNYSNSSTNKPRDINIPIIDLKETNSHSEIIKNVRDACENWGFFQIINHGIPQRVLDEMVDGVKKFHEMENAEKIKYYSRDFKKQFIYTSNVHLFTAGAANWNDMFLSAMAPNRPKYEELPPICRDILVLYSEYIKKLGYSLLELFSEALGLEPNHLKNIGCGDGYFIMGHYYPACPEPELTIGANSHTDAGFFTILLQDLLGGLQVLHENNWVNVAPVLGALVVNVADLLQLVSNDKLKSINHRVLAQKTGPRISVATIFRPFHDGMSKTYAPLTELVSEENPCVYREASLTEYMMLRMTEEKNQTSALSSFKVA